MYRAFTVLLQPTVRQAGLLERLLAAQRELYNAALEERRGAWSWERRRVTKYAQYRQLTGLRELRPELFSFGITVCRGTLSRLDEAFAGFFRHLGAGGRPGYPRFKANARWDSVSWPDVQCWRLDKTQGSGRPGCTCRAWASCGRSVRSGARLVLPRPSPCVAGVGAGRPLSFSRSAVPILCP
jgi:putative transposase